MNKITILGSGTSTGVPILGCKCIVCKSTDSRNKRLRTSALIETSTKKKILIDTSPDLRTQLLTAKVDDIDAVIMTHDHADHVLGMDDLRPFRFGKSTPLNIFAETSTAQSLRLKFPYIFNREKLTNGRDSSGVSVPQLDLKIIQDLKLSIDENHFLFKSLKHGSSHSLAFIQGKMGFITDCKEIPDNILQEFHDAKLEILVIECVQIKPHLTHLHLDLTLEYINKIQPQMAALIHMGHDWTYVDLSTQLAERGIKNVFPAVDGQSFFYSNS